MERKYSQQLLQSVSENVEMVCENGVDIRIKPIPDITEPGMLDPRIYASTAKLLNGIGGKLVRRMVNPGQGKLSDLKRTAKRMRWIMNRKRSIPVAKGVLMKDASVQNGDISIPIRIYTPEKPAAGLKPVFYYMHGGGFFLGNMNVVDEICKLMVEKSGYVAVNVEYRMAPEHPFPASLDDCYAVLQWIHQNAEQFGGDKNRICISGDSAGGNLATVCAMRDKDDGTKMVKAQALFYPSTDMSRMDEYIHRRDIFEYAPSQKKAILDLLDVIASMNSTPIKAYLQVEDDTIPYLSPLRGDLHDMPPCILLYGEFDVMRLESETYAQKLHDSGVRTKVVRYRGLIHGFADQVGIIPQAEDAIDEIARFMEETFAPISKRQCPPIASPMPNPR